jgi:hypothetical protein
VRLDTLESVIHNNAGPLLSEECGKQIHLAYHRQSVSQHTLVPYVEARSSWLRSRVPAAHWGTRRGPLAETVMWMTGRDDLFESVLRRGTPKATFLTRLRMRYFSALSVPSRSTQLSERDNGNTSNTRWVLLKRFVARTREFCRCKSVREADTSDCLSSIVPLSFSVGNNHHESVPLEISIV